MTEEEKKKQEEERKRGQQVKQDVRDTEEIVYNDPEYDLFQTKVPKTPTKQGGSGYDHLNNEKDDKKKK